MNTNNQAEENKVVSIQIMPFIEEPAAYDSSEYIVEQPEGPTKYTGGYYVRLRMEKPLSHFLDQTAAYARLKCVATASSQDDADFIAQAYAARHGVEVEPQPWKQQ
jgi:hypothetical protein